MNKELIIFKRVKKRKNFFESEYEASKHISKIWRNTDEWWNSKSLQKVRQDFCEEYVRSNSDLSRNLKDYALGEYCYVWNFGVLGKNDIKKYIKFIKAIEAQRYKKKFQYDKNLILGHTRLSILDLDQRNDQPMQSNDGRFI